MAAIVTRTRDFVAEVVDELKKVTWPDKAQLQQATLVVLVFVLIVSAIIWGMDLVVRNLIAGIIGIFT